MRHHLAYSKLALDLPVAVVTRMRKAVFFEILTWIKIKVERFSSAIKDNASLREGYEKRPQRPLICSCGRRWSAVALKNWRTFACLQTIQIMDPYMISGGLWIQRMRRASSMCISPANKCSDSGARDLHVPANSQSAWPQPMYEGPLISIPQNPPPLSVELGNDIWSKGLSLSNSVLAVPHRYYNTPNSLVNVFHKIRHCILVSLL